MEQVRSLAARIAILVFCYFFIVFFVQGVTSIPSEGDSIAYHIPIARSVLDGSVFSPSHQGYALGFYPGSGELLLSVLMFFQIPLNLYNLIGWVILAYLCVRLGKSYGLPGAMPILYAVSATTVLAMVRLMPTQTIDIWLAVFFTWSLLLLKEPKKSLRYFFWLGMALGLLIGTKFSGPLYAGVLLVLFGKPLLKLLSVQPFLIFLIPFFIFGLSWYVRNLVLTGNPFYPQPVLSLPGNERFHLLEWMGWQTVIFYPWGIFHMLFAFFSEYMLWIVAPLVAVWYLLTQRKEKAGYKEIKLVTIVGILNFLIFFVLPSTADNIITYLRYLFPAFIPLILVVFLLAERAKQLQYLIPLAVMNIVLLFCFTSHRPKLFLVYLLIASGILYLYPRLERVLCRE